MKTEPAAWRRWPSPCGRCNSYYPRQRSAAVRSCWADTAPSKCGIYFGKYLPADADRVRRETAIAAILGSRYLGSRIYWCAGHGGLVRRRGGGDDGIPGAL